MAGQKSIRLAKKDGDPSFPKAGFRRFSPAIPLPPRRFEETKRGDLGVILLTLTLTPILFLKGGEALAHL